MIKKIRVEQLTPGMFIRDFNCSWMNHPFLSNKAKVTNEKIIEKVAKSGIREVYIDTDRGLDVADVSTAEELKREIVSKT